jgi:hypothetical protein
MEYVMELRVEMDPIARATTALRCSKIRDLRELTVERFGDGVLLRGCAKSFYHKQLAQEVVRLALEGAEVSNHVEVVHAPE